MRVYIDGRFYPEEEAKVSVFDHGYLYGDGIYETLRSYGGVVFRMDEHLLRLKNSARLMGLQLPAGSRGMADAVYETLGENALRDAYIRITVSRGPGEIGLDPALCPRPTLVIMVSQFKEYPREMYEKGVKVSVVATRRNHPECLDPAIKSTNFLNNIFAKLEAKRAGAVEGIMLNHAGYVAEGTVSNVFIVKKNTLFTPPAIAGILEGVTRSVVMRLAGKMGIPVFEELFNEVQVWQADEVFLTNTSMEVMPVTQVDETTIAGGVPGPVTQDIGRAYQEEVGRGATT